MARKLAMVKRWRSVGLVVLASFLVLALGACAPVPRPGSVPPPVVDGATPLLGANVADLKNASYLDAAGMTWMKGFLAWERIEPRPGVRDWGDIDKLIPARQEHGMKVLARVDRVPSWARPSNDHWGAPPDPQYMKDWERFLTDLAWHGRHVIDAWEVWNEPNLTIEWGGRPADPEAYAEFLVRSYRAIKRGNPHAVVVGFSLAPTHGTPGGAMDTLVFLERALQAGAWAGFDVYGAHPYGFGQPPEVAGRFTFRSVEEEVAILRAYGVDAPVWATEWGWQLGPEAEVGDACMAYEAWQQSHVVDEATAADYIVRAIDFAETWWPWMEVLFLWNLDFTMAPWYEDRCEPMLYHAVLDKDGQPRDAYRALVERAARLTGEGRQRRW